MNTYPNASASEYECTDRHTYPHFTSTQIVEKDMNITTYHSESYISYLWQRHIHFMNSLPISFRISWLWKWYVRLHVSWKLISVFLAKLKWKWPRYCDIDMIHRPSYLELANFSIFSMFNTLANGFEWERGLTLAMILTIFYWMYLLCLFQN